MLPSVQLKLVLHGLLLIAADMGVSSRGDAIHENQPVTVDRMVLS